MKHLIKITKLTLLIAIFATNAFSQEFLKDGSMKLKEISNNKKYGYVPDFENSIKVGNSDNILSYLFALKGPNGEKTFASRIGSCCPYSKEYKPNDSGMLAKWSITYSGLKEPIILYLNKNVYEEPKCPIGLTFKIDNETFDDLKYPQDSIKKVSPCKSSIFAVKGILDQEKILRRLPQPDTNPKYKFGIDELQKYFLNNSLTDENVKKMIFRVSISFLVNCDGKAGNFKLEGHGLGELEYYQNKVLAIVNNMPQEWQPATKNGEVVDCYQELSFTIIGGLLNKLSYN